MKCAKCDVSRFQVGLDAAANGAKQSMETGLRRTGEKSVIKSDQRIMIKGQIAEVAFPSQKLPPHLGNPGPYLMHGFLVHTSKCISIGSFLAQIMVRPLCRTEKQSDTHRPQNIGNNRPHVCNNACACGIAAESVRSSSESERAAAAAERSTE